LLSGARSLARRSQEGRFGPQINLGEHDMAKFLLVFHGGLGMPASDAQREQVMAAWGAWFGELGPAIVDGGNPTADARTIGPDGSVSEGGGANPTTGYTLIEADSIEDAVIRAKGCPILQREGSIEVCQTVDP
jgi:hypothetical protein